MATQKARIGPMLGGAIAVLGLASLFEGLSHAACLLTVFFGLPVEILWKALPSFILAVWHLSGPCLFAHSGLLYGLLQVSLSCGHFVLASPR